VVFAGFQSSYRPPIVTAPDRQAAGPVNDDGRSHLQYGGTSGSLVDRRPPDSDVAIRLTPSLQVALITVAILPSASSFPVFPDITP